MIFFFKKHLLRAKVILFSFSCSGECNGTQGEGDERQDVASAAEAGGRAREGGGSRGGGRGIFIYSENQISVLIVIQISFTKQHFAPLLLSYHAHTINGSTWIVAKPTPIRKKNTITVRPVSTDVTSKHVSLPVQWLLSEVA